ncbi:hypothetical protein ACFC8N_42535 [Streptomyces sp. NPDC055966]|uniref:hypothetical protein n=1 Tax=Streptomyces sp. NPDC055966 TaxID=3345669 RepID=UPI0035DC7F6C
MTTDQASSLTDVAVGALNQLCPAAAMAIALQGDPEEILQHVIEAVLAEAAAQQQKKTDARVAELESIVGNAYKLTSAWLRTAGRHHSVSSLETVKNDPLKAGIQEGCANQYSDCANELRDVLNGEDPNNFDHSVGSEVGVDA